MREPELILSIVCDSERAEVLSWLALILDTMLVRKLMLMGMVLPNQAATMRSEEDPTHAKATGEVLYMEEEDCGCSTNVGQTN